MTAAWRRAGRGLVPAMILAALALAAPAAHAQARDSSATARRDSSATSLAPADSLPSADARNVLRSIPEPLTPEEEGSPPDSLRPAPPPFAEPDTTAADTSGVPIPRETAPLGEVPGAPNAASPVDSAWIATPDSSATPGSSAVPPAAVPGSGTPAMPSTPAAPRTPAAPSAASPDTCWRLQIAAPAERPEAEAKRLAAESQLLVKFTIEVEGGRNKVRSLGCMTRTMGEGLRARAELSGFEGAFLLRYGPDGKPIPLNPPAPAKKAPVKKAPAKTGATRR